MAIKKKVNGEQTFKSDFGIANNAEPDEEAQRQSDLEHWRNYKLFVPKVQHGASHFTQDSGGTWVQYGQVLESWETEGRPWL